MEDDIPEGKTNKQTKRCETWRKKSRKWDNQKVQSRQKIQHPTNGISNQEIENRREKITEAMIQEYFLGLTKMSFCRERTHQVPGAVP